MVTIIDQEAFDRAREAFGREYSRSHNIALRTGDASWEAHDEALSDALEAFLITYQKDAR